MRISDWSSDVCSSDLGGRLRRGSLHAGRGGGDDEVDRRPRAGAAVPALHADARLPVGYPDGAVDVPGDRPAGGPAARLRPAGRSGQAAAVRGRGGGGAAQGLGRGVAAGGQPLASGVDAMPWWLPAAVALALVAGSEEHTSELRN